MAFAALAGFCPAGRRETATVGALSWRWRQGGSFGAEPFAHGGVRLGLVLRAHRGEGLIEFRIALAGGFRDGVPLQRLDLVDRDALTTSQYPRQAILRDRVVLFGRLAQQ